MRGLSVFTMVVLLCAPALVQGQTPQQGEPTVVKNSPEEKRRRAAKKQQTNREERISYVYSLMKKGDKASIQKVLEIVQGDEELAVRATAVRVLGQKKREDLIPLFKSFVEKDGTMVGLEAAIVLYKWGEQNFALPVLEKYSERGVALRRAFMTGRKDGKGLYDKNALKFLMRGFNSTNILTRLDAAVGLYDLGDKKKSLEVFREVMEGDHPFYVRIAALNYLRHFKKDDKVRAIIQIAARDTNKRVKQRAKALLHEVSLQSAKTSGAAGDKHLLKMEAKKEKQYLKEVTKKYKRRFKKHEVRAVDWPGLGVVVFVGGQTLRIYRAADDALLYIPSDEEGDPYEDGMLSFEDDYIVLVYYRKLRKPYFSTVRGNFVAHVGVWGEEEYTGCSWKTTVTICFDSNEREWVLFCGVEELMPPDTKSHRRCTARNHPR